MPRKNLFTSFGASCLLFAALVHGFVILTAETWRSEFRPYPFPSLSTIGADYAALHAAAHAARAGLDPYRNNAALGEPFRDPYPFDEQFSAFVYPPIVAYLMRPFTYLSFQSGYRAFTIGTLLLTLLSIFAFAGWFEDKWLYLGCTAFLVMFSYPLRLLLERGNFDAIPIALACVGLSFAGRKRTFPAATCLALATLVKIYPAIFVAYLGLRRQWRTVAWTAAAVAVGVLVTSPLLWIEMARTLSMQEIDSVYVWVGNHSLFSLFALLMPGHLSTAQAGAYIVAGAMAALLAWRVWSERGKNLATTALEVGCCAILMTIVNPTSPDPRLIGQVITLAACLAFAQVRGIGDRRDRFMLSLSAPLLVLIFAPTIYIPREAHVPYWVGVLVGCKATYLVLLYCALLWRHVTVNRAAGKP